MAVETFSVKKYDESLIDEIKKLSTKNGLIFSHIVIQALKEYNPKLDIYRITSDDK